jgi:hypothetical protein
MRRRLAFFLAFSLLGTLPSASAEPPQPPHAWLFGAWSGGLFPITSSMNAEACLSQPVVIFTRDVVLRATLVDQLYTQRLISTVRVTPTGFEFTFAPAESAAPASAVLGIGSAPAAAGFGCDTDATLHVQRRGENEIVFPGCRDFPNPLVRCQAR